MPLSIPAPGTICPAISAEPFVAIYYGYPGVGKSPSIAALPDNFYVDCQLGTKYVNCRRVPVANYSEFIEAARYWREHRTRFVTIDDLTTLYRWSIELATDTYRRKPYGVNFGAKGEDSVLDLLGTDASGRSFNSGYRFVREAFMSLVKLFFPNNDNRLILVGHVRDAIMADIGQGEKGGKTNVEFDGKDLDIDGKLRNVLVSECDLAIYMYRSATSVLKLTTAIKRNNAFVKCRCPHLLNKTFDFHTPTTLDDWRQIYPESIAAVCDAKAVGAPSNAPAVEPPVTSTPPTP